MKKGSEIKEIHRQAMSFSQKAYLALEAGRDADAKGLYEQAFETERIAALSLVDQLDKEPTRSILFKSAAALAKKCGRYREAEQMIGYALAGNPPEDVAEEIRQILEDINFYRHLENQFRDYGHQLAQRERRSGNCRRRPR